MTLQFFVTNRNLFFSWSWAWCASKHVHRDVSMSARGRPSLKTSVRNSASCFFAIFFFAKDLAFFLSFFFTLGAHCIANRPSLQSSPVLQAQSAKALKGLAAWRADQTAGEVGEGIHHIAESLWLGILRWWPLHSFHTPFSLVIEDAQHRVKIACWIIWHSRVGSSISYSSWNMHCYLKAVLHRQFCNYSTTLIYLWKNLLNKRLLVILDLGVMKKPDKRERGLVILTIRIGKWFFLL